MKVNTDAIILWLLTVLCLCGVGLLITGLVLNDHLYREFGYFFILIYFFCDSTQIRAQYLEKCRDGR